MLCPQPNCGQGLFPEDDGRRVQCPRIIGGCGVSGSLFIYFVIMSTASIENTSLFPYIADGKMVYTVQSVYSCQFLCVLCVVCDLITFQILFHCCDIRV